MTENHTYANCQEAAKGICESGASKGDANVVCEEGAQLVACTIRGFTEPFYRCVKNAEQTMVHSCMKGRSCSQQLR